MSTDTLSFLNFGIHSLLISVLGWLTVRFVVRDALRRSIVANIAILFSLIGPFTIAYWPYPYLGDSAPTLTAIHQTLEADWRIVVPPPNDEAAAPPATVAAKAPAFTMNEVVRGLRWVFWAGVVLILVRHLWQTWIVLRWCWRLRDITQAEADALPKDIRFERISVFEQEGTPCVAGWLMPVIAVPASAFQNLSPEQWRWLMRHEEEHLRGNDTVSAWLHGCLRAFLWWNPFVHALMEEFARAREEVCDAAALDDEHTPTAYAGFLLSWAAQPQLDRAGVMPIASSRPARRLKARLVALMDTRSVRKKAGWIFTLSCAAAVLLGPMLVASVGFAIATTGASAAEPPAATPAVDDGRMHTRVFHVPPSFGGEKTAKAFLESKGISFSGGASAVFTRETSRLIVRNTLSQLDKVEELVAAAAVLPTRMTVTASLIQADGLLARQGQILSPQEAEDLVRSVSQTKGINLMSTPGVTTLSDQPAQVQVVHTNPADARQFVGVSLEILVTALPNGKATLKAKVELGAEANATHPWPPKTAGEIDWKKVLLHTMSGSSDLATGESLVLHLTTPTRPVTVLISTKALKPDGTEAASFNEIINAVPTPGPEGDAGVRDASSQQETRRLADKVAAKPRQPQVRVSIKVAEVTAPVGKILGDWDPGELTWQANAASKPVPITEAPPEVRNQFAVSGVLTGEQLSSVIRALAQKEKEVTITTVPDAVATSGQEMIFNLDGVDGSTLRITAIAAADGHTLDVETRLPDLEPNQNRLVTTTVTIWSGHTIILSGTPPDKPGHTHILFITATLQG